MVLWYVKYIMIFIIFIIYQLSQILNVINCIPRSIYLFVFHPLYVMSWILLFNIYKARSKKEIYFIYLICIVMSILLLINVVLHQEKIIFKYSEVIQLSLLSYIVYDTRKKEIYTNYKYETCWQIYQGFFTILLPTRRKQRT